ncbi:MAG: PASTA domain-containing protein [bacterium]
MTAVAPTLPNVVGLSADSATRLLARMKVSITRRDSSTNAAARDQVIDQQPQQGTPLAAIRSVVLIVAIPVSKVRLIDPILTRIVAGVIAPPANAGTAPSPNAPPTAIVPRLVGRNVPNAVSAIAFVGLRVDKPVVVDFSDVVDSGFVFQQHPPQRTQVDTGSAVKIWVSLGPHRTTATVPTPNVIGQPLDVAARTLRIGQLVVGHVDTLFESGGKGEVEHQLPEPGALAHPGDAVALRVTMMPPVVQVPPVIDLGPADAQATIARKRTVVPPLDGLTRNAAEQRLTGDGLSLGRVVVSDGGDAPVVVAQRPAAGDSTFLNDRISVTLATRPPTLQTATTPRDTTTFTTVTLVAVPLVKDMTFESARRLIDSVGLTTASTVEDTARSFIVRSQSPAAGSLVRVGAAVTLDLEGTDPPRSVPHLVGLARIAAEAHARADGFTISIVNHRRVLLQFSDRVSTQEPDAATLARGDQLINVDLAIPLIPPVPAAILLLLGTVGTAVKVRNKRTRRESHRPLSDLDFVVAASPRGIPVPSPVPGDRVIRTAITFTLDTTRGEWMLDTADTSLIGRIDSHD